MLRIQQQRRRRLLLGMKIKNNVVVVVRIEGLDDSHGIGGSNNAEGIESFYIFIILQATVSLLSDFFFPLPSTILFTGHKFLFLHKGRTRQHNTVPFVSNTQRYNAHSCLWNVPEGELNGRSKASSNRKYIYHHHQQQQQQNQWFPSSNHNGFRWWRASR